MKFGMEKYALLIMKGGKREIIEGIELPNQERIRMLGKKENYKYLRLLDADTIKQVEMKEKIGKEHSDEQENFLKTNDNRNLIKRTNSLVVLCCRTRAVAQSPDNWVTSVDKNNTCD